MKAKIRAIAFHITDRSDLVIIYQEKWTLCTMDCNILTAYRGKTIEKEKETIVGPH